MFNVGPLELIVLAIVGLVVLGPDRLPDIARDAARMLKSLRELATGAREQLRDELGPEFADVDLRNLNPRTAIQRAVFGDDDVLGDLRKFDPRRFDPKAAAQNALFGDEPAVADGAALSPEAGLGVHEADVEAIKPVTFAKHGESRVNGAASNGAVPNGTAAVNGAAPATRPRPRPRPGPPPTTSYDDAT